jgi:hypothetical protein
VHRHRARVLGFTPRRDAASCGVSRLLLAAAAIFEGSMIHLPGAGGVLISAREDQGIPDHLGFRKVQTVPLSKN